MIDLHVHSTFSDGTDSVEEIVEKANDLGITHLSITDHNKCTAYLKENKHLFKKFKGTVIVGTEIFTQFHENAIDILVYHYNVDKMKEFLDANYPSYQEDKIIRLHKTLKKLKENGVRFDKQLLIEQMQGSKLMSEYVVEHIMSYEENLTFFNHKKLNQREFLDEYLCNPQSKFYVNFNTIYPSLEKLISTVKEVGGITFLAHAYAYKFDVTKYLDELVAYGLNGFECYHPCFTKEQSDYLVDYCEKHNLLISGGSDYHGNSRDNELGKALRNHSIIKPDKTFLKGQ